ncbi:nicotinate phosphoribosyltransferase [Myxococcota bacterium]|nr:nicotinate phosphoribosyltransferase [Myxococcota bacterium]
MTDRSVLMTDLYQLTMGAAYFKHRTHQTRVSFELFVRRLPPERRYLVFAGLETVLAFLRDLRFTESEIAYLKQVPGLRRAIDFDFVEYLRDFRFRGDVWAMPEGTVFFENEPVLRVTGTLFEAQLVETFLLSAVNTETMIASKAARIVRAAAGGSVLEFGTRRTSPDEALESARAAYVAGFSATSNVAAGYRWDIPIAGTHAHSWVMAHDDESVAYARYVDTFPDGATLLVDTYDTIEGTRRAIAAAGTKLRGVRLDSGDLLALSKEVRALLDAAGLHEAKIVGSGDLNEYKIEALRRAGAPIDQWGVGTDLVRSRDSPTLGGVYKLVYDHDADRPVAKFSESKSTLPGTHQVFRVVRDGKAAGDIVGTEPEFHVDATPLLVEWMQGGKLVRDLPSLAKLRANARTQLDALPEHLHRFEPVTEGERYPVRVSDALRALSERVRGRELGERG